MNEREMNKTRVRKRDERWLNTGKQDKGPVRKEDKKRRNSKIGVKTKQKGEVLRRTGNGRTENVQEMERSGNEEKL